MLGGCEPGIYAPSAYDHFRFDQHAQRWLSQLKAGNEAYGRWEVDGAAHELENAIGHYKQAEEAAQGMKRVAHPKSKSHQDMADEDLATALKNLGSAHLDLRRLPEAEHYLKKALKVRERVMGPKHPRAADVAHDLATVYRFQGRMDEALPLYDRAAQIYEMSRDRSGMALAYHSQGHVHEARGRIAEAESTFGMALATTQSILGPDPAPRHPGYLSLIHHLRHYAVITRKAGRAKEADRYDAIVVDMVRQIKVDINSLRKGGRDADAKKLERRLESIMTDAH